MKSFAGTTIEMSWATAQPTAAGHHLELWARDANNGILRVDASYAYTDCKGNQHTIYTYGLQVKQAITPDDPCMIDSQGHLLTSPDAYKTTTIAGVTLTPQEQAQEVLNRIAQVTQKGTNGAPLYAVVGADDTPPVNIPADSPASVRLAACQLYWCESPLTYTPNPAQLTAPAHGLWMGTVAYTTTMPPAGYDGMRLDSPTNLKGIQELWITDESVPVSMVDATQQGPVFLDGKPDTGGQDVVHIDLLGATSSGTAALYTNLDDPSVQF